MSTTKILLADDEARMRKLVSDFLKREGYVVLEAADGQEALDLFYRDKAIGLVILDVMMPRKDGWVVCKEIRKESSVPIIMLTARSEESDELFGFDLGADEYVSKPFSPMILVARVKALLRRAHSEQKPVRVVGRLQIDEGKHTVSIDSERINLSPKEYELLAYLVANDGIALSREQILASVWDYDYFGDVRTVDTHIKRLRSKLGPLADYIETVRGFGYRFEVTS